jgi:PAS domain S-box-containing protein
MARTRTKDGNGMSARDSFGFFLLGVGLLCARPGRGLLPIVSSNTPGAMLARWLLLTPVIGLLLSGTIYVVLERTAGGDSTLRVWAFGVSNLVFLTVPIWIAVHLLHLVGLERDQAHHALEGRVEQRTAELTRANVALVDRDRELHLVMDSGPTLIAYVDAECRYKRMNRGYNAWYPAGNDHGLGLHVREVLGEEAWHMVEPYVARALAGEVVTFERELPLPGGPRWMQATYTPDRDPDDQVRGFVVHALDIGPQKRAEQALREARDRLECQAVELEHRVAERTAKLQETVGDLESFSYSVAHDMRAPLRGMQGFARLLLECHASQLSAEAREYLERIASSACRMDMLIQDVLNYTHVLKTRTLLVPVDLDQLVHHLIATYPDWQPPSVEIRIQGPLPAVIGHEGFLTQCVSNLVGNAVKFVAPGNRAPRPDLGGSRKYGRQDLVRGQRHWHSTQGPRPRLPHVRTSKSEVTSTKAQVSA